MSQLRTTACLSLLLVVPACSGEKADRILINGKTPAGSAGPVEAVALRDGKIMSFGSNPTIQALAGSQTEVIDLAGQTLLPGFIDHHVHLLNVGLSLLNREGNQDLFLDLSGVRSLGQLQDLIAGRAREVGEGRWILGKGWSQGAWGESSLPNRIVLDEAAPRNPVYLTRVDGHAGWANSVALQRAGIDLSTPDPEGGRILRDAAGEATGVLLERANEAVLSQLPGLQQGVIRRAFETALTRLSSLGITEVYDAGFLQPPGVVGLNWDLESALEALVELDQAAPLPVTVHLMIPAPTALAEKVVSAPENFRQLSPRVGVTHLKLFADGALGSRGAALSHPFADDPSTLGVARMSREQIQDWATRALQAGLGVATHAIGDAAVASVLDAYEEVLREQPSLDRSRLRIEHVSYLSEADLVRAASLGVVLSVQPNFVAPDEGGATMEDSRLGAQNTARVYAFSGLQDAGARLVGGSDAFTVPGGPLMDFYCAATRKNLAGLPPGGWHPEQRLDRESALRLFTTSWRVGMPANLTILSADPLTVAESDLLSIQVVATYHEGERVWGEDGGRAGGRP